MSQTDKEAKAQIQAWIQEYKETRERQKLPLKRLEDLDT